MVHLLFLLGGFDLGGGRNARSFLDQLTALGYTARSYLVMEGRAW